MTRKASAFTLVEVLLVSALIAGISLAVFSCLSNGLKLWDRSRVLMVEEDVSFFMDRLASELRNSFPFSTLAFTGEERALSFPTVVTSKMDRAGSRASEGYAEGLGMVQYVFDTSSGNLFRSQANYAQALHNSWAGARIVCAGLRDIHFRYFTAGSSDYRSSQGTGDVFPAGIEIELLFMSGSQEKKLRRYIAIPAGI
jgi:hypothetical protein